MKRTMAAALGALVLCAACGSRPSQDPVQAKAREHGIEILGVQLMADGDVARLNYRVVDYAAAKRSLRNDVRLSCEGAGRPLPVMSTGRLGQLKQKPTRDGRPQFMLFMNPGRELRKGDHAVLTIGGAPIDGIPVS